MMLTGSRKTWLDDVKEGVKSFDLGCTGHKQMGKANQGA